MAVTRSFFFLLSAIFIFLMHIHFPNLGGVIAQPREYFIWIAVFAIVLLSVIKIIRDKAIVLPAFRVRVLLFIMLLVSSSAFNPVKNMDMFIINALHLIAGAGLWFSLHQLSLNEREKANILLIIFASAVIESATGIIQFFGAYKYLPVTPAPSAGIAGGSFQQAKLFASWTATGLIISLYFISSERFKSWAKKAKMAFLCLVPMLSLSIAIATQRTGVISAAIGIISMLAFRSRYYLAAKKILIVWLMLFLTGFAGGHYLLGIKDKTGAGNVVQRQIKWFTDSEQGSYTKRILMYKTSLEMFREKPFFGQGFGNFGSLYMYRQAEVLKAEPKYKALAGSYTSHPHNEILKIMVESGVAGIIGLLIVIAGFIKMLNKLRREQAGLHLALLTPLLAHLMVEFPFELSTVHYILFLLLVYMTTSHFVEEKRIRLQALSSKSIIAFAGVAFFIVSAYTVKTFYDYMNMVIYYTENTAYFSQINTQKNNALASPFYEANGVDSPSGAKTDAKKIRPASAINIEGAAGNIYLRNWAMPMEMFAEAGYAVRDVRRNMEFLNHFLKWSEAEKQRLPSEAVFIADASVLLNMGIQLKEWAYFDEAMKSSEQGFALYPNSAELKKIMPKIAGEAFKSVAP